MDIYDFSNIAASNWSAADSQVTDGIYIYLHGSPVVGNSTLIRLLEGTAPQSAEDAPDIVVDPDYSRDGIVNFADFATFAADWFDCTDPNPPCNYVP